jgi:hypothetical protein
MIAGLIKTERVDDFTLNRLTHIIYVDCAERF